MSRCGIVIPKWHDDGGNHRADTSCHLKDEHEGRHEYMNHRGILVSWETDMDCNCEDCNSDDANDWCLSVTEGNKGDESEEHY